MRIGNGESYLKRRIWIVGLCSAVVLLDQITKLWMLNLLKDRRVIHIIWTLDLRLVRNTGALFGIGSNSGVIFFVAGIFFVAIFLFLVFSRKQQHFIQEIKYLVGIALIAGGAVGNSLDRLIRRENSFSDGGVVDFIDFGWWPVFNLADVCITVGLVFTLGTVVFSLTKQQDT